MKIGEITQEQLNKNRRKDSRNRELLEKGGWTATNRPHKSDKTYTRKVKHK